MNQPQTIKAAKPPRRARRPLTIVLPALVFILTLITSVLVGTAYSYFNHETVIAQRLQEMEGEKIRLRLFVENSTDELVKDIRILAGTEGIRSVLRLSKTRQTNLIDEKNAATALFQRVMMLRDEVLRIAVYNSQGEPVLVQTQPNAANLASETMSLQQQELQNLPAAHKTPLFVSGVRLYSDRDDSRNDRRPLVQIANQIVDTGGSRLGTFVVTVDLTPTLGKLSFTGIENRAIYLTQEDGYYLMRPDQFGGSQVDFSIGETLQDQFPALAGPIEFDDPDLDYRKLQTASGEHTIASFLTLDLSSFDPEQHHLHALIVSNDYNAISPMSQVVKVAFLIAILATLISGFVIRQLLRPLQTILKAINLFSSGDKIDYENINDNINAPNEIGEISDAFNDMVHAVRQRTEELSNAKSEMESTASRLKAILSTAVDGIITIDDQGTIVSFNQGAEAIFGYSLDEVINTNISRLMSSQYAKVHDNYLANYQRTGVSRIIGKNRDESAGTSGQLRGKRKNGEIFPIDLSVSRVDSDAGVIFCGIIRDISEAVATQAELIKAKEKAETVAKLKSDFLATMSHEIRTPMNAVQGMLGILLRGNLNPEQTRYASLARSSADSLLAIINDILDFSKGEANRLALENIRFNLSDLLNELFSGLAYRAQEKGLECILDIDPRIPDVVVSDPARLRQILINLLGNAIKFTESGEIVLKASLASSTDTELRIDFTVIDSGIGIAVDQLDSIFGSFTQADASTTRQYGGTGLGLAIVKQLCQLMGGTVTARNRSRKGSEFHCNLLFGLDPQTKTSSLADRGLRQELSGRHVLVIDDNPVFLDILQQQLTREGLVVTSGVNLEQVLGNTSATIDIAMIDAQQQSMPLKVCIEMLNNSAGSPPVIALTPVAASLSNQELIAAGCSANITKPVNLQRMLDSVVAVLGGDLDMLELPLKDDLELQGAQGMNSARVLLVEDIPVNQELGILILNELGLTAIEIAANGLEAIQTLQTAPAELPFDLVLMDCQMPEMDGYEASKQIRDGAAGEHYKSIPIIALTANAMSEDREKCIAAGMSDHISKPIQVDNLSECVGRWLKIEQPATTLTAATQHTADVWDEEAILGRIGGDRDKVAFLLKLFLDGLDDDLANMDKPLAEADYASVARASHNIKGAAGNLGAVKLLKTLKALEQACREQDEASIITLRSQVSVDLDNLTICMQAFINTSIAAEP